MRGAVAAASATCVFLVCDANAVGDAINMIETGTRTIASREEALQRARDLAPSIRERVRETEQLRRIPDATVRELHESGLFGALTPRCFGGSELGIDTVLDVSAILGEACGSTGWVYGVLTGHAWLIAKFSDAAQREVFGTADVLIASLLRLGGTAPERAPGGFRWRGGQGKFCSGIDHSQWVLVGGSAPCDDGATEARFFLIPRGDVEIVDDWYTVGLRGTGSKSIIVRDAYIPQHRTVTFASMLDGTADGAMQHSRYYQLPYTSVWPLSLPGTAVGTARAALASFIASTGKRVAGMEDEQLAEQATSFVRIADVSARIDAAHGVLQRNAVRLNDLGPKDLSESEIMRYRRDLAFAVQELRRAADGLFEASGGTGVYDGSDAQRLWRDNNTASQHFGFAWERTAYEFGRNALSLPPSKYERRGGQAARANAG
jgi:3-hydroxy-9,10-secoandrosta-1,3,5(10)-triene-9,17-dione monooxygenase